MSIFAQDSAYLRADSILTHIQKHLLVVEESTPLIPVYHYASRLENQAALASEAQQLLEKSLANISDSSQHSYYWSKLAFAIHFQIKDYSYRGKLTDRYHQSISWIDKAIQAEIVIGSSERLAQLYLNAAQLAIPHMYYAFITQPAIEAEKLAYSYIDKAAEVQLELGNPTAALEIQRSIENQEVDYILKRIELGIEVEGEHSLAVANDISQAYKIHASKTLETEQKQAIEAYGLLALKSYELQPTEAVTEHQRLLSQIALGYRSGFPDTPQKALDVLLECQALELKNDKDLYSNAFLIAAIYIEMEAYDNAMKQYHLALSDEGLSHTDTEHAHLGLALCHHQKDEKKNAAYYMAQIVDNMALNGISSFPNRFLDNFRPKLKEIALELAIKTAKANTLLVIKEWKI